MAASAAFGRNGPEWEGKLEGLLKKRFEADEAILCASGTQALELSIRAAMTAVGNAPRVLALPAYGCFDLVTASVGADVALIPYDLDPSTLSPDPESLRAALARGASAVVVAPLYGYPVDWGMVRDQADAYGAVVIEDAAQAAGATWKGRRVGALGELTVLSFGRGKGWTGGGGGALLARGPITPQLTGLRDSLAPPSSGVSIWMKSVLQWAMGRPELYGVPSRIPWLGLGETRFRTPRPVAQAPVVCSALTLVTASAAVKEVAVRRRRADRLRTALQASRAFETSPCVQPVEGGVPGDLRLPVLIPGGLHSFPNRRSVAALGISGGYPRALTDLPPARERMRGSSSPAPGARLLVERLVTLPTHRYVTDSELRALVALVARATT